MISVYAPPKLSAAERDAARSLFGREPLRFSFDQYEIVLAPHFADTYPSTPLSLDVSAGHYRFQVQLAHLPFAHQLMEGCSGGDLFRLPGPIAAALLQHTWRIPLNALSQATGLPWVVEDFEAENSEGVTSHWQLSVNGTPIAMRVICHQDAHTFLLEQWSQFQDLAQPTPSFPVVGQLVYGGVFLAPELLQQLEPGDLLLPHWFDGPEQARLRFAPNLEVRVRLQENEMIVEDIMHTPSPATCADLEVELCFELARQAFDLEQVTALAPGQVLELNTPARAVLDVVSAGHKIARGELVEIDNRLGIRLLEVFRHASS